MSPASTRCSIGSCWPDRSLQAFLTEAKRGGEAGHRFVARRFNSAMEDDWGTVLRLLMMDTEREEEKKRRSRGTRRKEKKRQRRSRSRERLPCLTSQRVRLTRLTSFGVASTKDHNAMATIRAQYVERDRELTATIGAIEEEVRLDPHMAEDEDICFG